MSQHDYDIANQTAPATRSDLNLALKALASTSSGASAPTTTFADQLYYNTTSNILYKRNEANTAWISLGTVDETNSKFEPNQTFATQAQAEAGTNNTYAMTPLRTAQAIALNAAAVKDYQVFTASGTWTKPSGLSTNALVYFEVVGGGGGGSARVRGGSSTVGSVSGGAGGGMLTGFVLASSLGATVAVTVGAGGTGGAVVNAQSSANGNVGGQSSFGTYTCPGGAGGVTGGTTDAAPTSHGRDGYVGGDGSSVAGDTSVNAVYGGGAGGGKNVNLSNGPGTSVFSGAGGAGAYSTTNPTASAGTAPGGGGGSALSADTTNATAIGGNGARGEVRVWTIG